MAAEERKVKLRYGTVNFEKRKHPRFSVDLPVEYSRTDLAAEQARAMNASEGGLLLHLPEQMAMGHHLTLKLFFTMGAELNTIETVVEVVWVDIHLDKERGDYRTGVRFVQISAEDVARLQEFLKSLSA